MLRHIVPNVMAPFLIIVTAQLGSAILTEASLGLDHGIGHLASMSPHQRLKRVSDLVILSHDD